MSFRNVGFLTMFSLVHFKRSLSKISKSGASKTGKDMREIAKCEFVFSRQGQLCIRCLRGVERDDMSSMLDGDDDDRSAISSIILPSGQDSPREDLVNTKLIKFDVSFVWLYYIY